LNNRNNNPIFTKWCTPVAIFGAFLFTIFGAYSITDYNYPSAGILADNRVVFNIKGNNYRLIVKINHEYGLVWIRFVGTHAEYDKVNANEI
jgi:hypothetical protein